MRKFRAVIMVVILIVASAVIIGCDKEMYKLSCENDVTTLKPGESVQLILGAEDLSNIAFKIDEGEEYATISANGLLTIKDSAVPGKVVEVVAEKGGREISNALEITISSVGLVSLAAESSKTEILPNGFATLKYTAAPANTTEKIEWKIIDGTDIAEIVGDKLFVKENASAGTEIRVKAIGETMSSNELTFSVALTSSEKLLLSVESPKSIDAGKSTNENIIVTVFNGDFQEVAGQEIEYVILEGEEYISLDEDGYTCALEAIGDGVAKVRVTLKNSNQSQDIEIDCIKAPDSILIPEALQDKTNITLECAVNSEINGFNFEILGDNVCQDLVYTFEKWNGAEYISGNYGYCQDGKLKFTEQGKIRVVAKSNAGSVSEKSVQVVFNVNDGVNVSTFEEFRNAMLGSNGKPINIINLNKLGQRYGYNLVPSLVINDSENENSYVNIQMHLKGKSVKINGNGYSIDLSGMKYFENFTSDYGALIKIDATEEELAKYSYKTGENADTSEEKNARKRTLTKADYSVEIKDLNIIGNTSIDGTIGTAGYKKETSLVTDGDLVLRSAFRRAIEIGGDRAFIAYHVNIENVDIKGFQVGIRVSHAVGNSKISGVSLTDCFANGIEASASIITFEDMVYGPCGAAGIEITPDSCDTAGFGFSENQTITFAGDISTTNITAGDTVYLKLFAEGVGTTIPAIVKGSMVAQGGTEAQMSNVLSAEENVIFIALIFNGDNVNTSCVQYSNELNDGIVNFADLVARDSHKYIILPLAYDYGNVLLYNWNYVANSD